MYPSVIYDGEWRDDKPHGLGTYKIHPEGQDKVLDKKSRGIERINGQVTGSLFLQVLANL